MQLPLPAEILDEIFSYLDSDGDCQTLSSCSLVRRANWHPVASRRLFRSLLFHAAIAYAPGYSGRRVRLATFKDFLAFLKTCERASVYTRSLTLSGRISSGYRGPHSTGPIRSAQLSLDVLVDILRHLPKLRDLTIKSVAICPPSMFFFPPTRPTFSLVNLEFDYQALYTSALYPTLPMAFHLPDIISLFSSLDTLTMWSVPELRSAPETTFTLRSASREKTRLKTLKLGGSGSSNITHYLSSLSKLLSPGCVRYAHIHWIDRSPCSINSNAVETFLEGPGARVNRFAWDIATSPSLDHTTATEELPALPLPALSRNPALMSLSLTRRLIIDPARLLGNQRAFESVINVLLSTSPKRRSRETVLRRIRLVLVLEFHNTMDPFNPPDTPRHPDRAVVHLIRQLRWDRLDEIVVALGWDSDEAAKTVEGALCGILVEFQLPSLLCDVAAQARDIIITSVSRRTRDVLFMI